jgi:hypothetical protein
MHDYETPGATHYGAQMGRSPLPEHKLPFDTADKLRLHRVYLDSGGYDKGGAYWGIGLPLYYAEDQAGRFRYLRAEDRADAKSRFPQARFYR